MTKYNSVENAEKFIEEQVAWCLTNGYKDFTIWSNGKELQAVTDDNDFASVFRRGELKTTGYWKALQIVNGKQVSVLP